MKNLYYPGKDFMKGEIPLPASKSLSNRWLILSALFPEIRIDNLSAALDTRLLHEALGMRRQLYHLENAGTTFRFLTSYIAVNPSLKGEIILTGNERMKQRPIGELVEALRGLGADISYAEHQGYPPLIIRPVEVTGCTVHIGSGTSSQFISSLLLVAPSLQRGLEIHYDRENLISSPYVEMTLSVLREMGVRIDISGEAVRIYPYPEKNDIRIYIEPDWTAASYYYSLAALHGHCEIRLPGLRQNSLQGDRVLTDIYRKFGVESRFTDKGLTIWKTQTAKVSRHLRQDLKKHPDLAQTLLVTCLGMGISCGITGLESLAIKETDRLTAMKRELQKFGAKVRTTKDSIHVVPPEILNRNVEIHTYGDHRMAMAFAPLSVKVPLGIDSPEVVEKSYPEFWKDFEAFW